MQRGAAALRGGRNCAGTHQERQGRRGKAEAWNALQGDAKHVSEVKTFMEAVETRFGAEEVRAFDRSGMFGGAKVAAGERSALFEVGRHVQAAKEGGRAAESLAQALAAATKRGLGPRMRP